MENNPTAGLAAIAQLGQAALDAIYAEVAIQHPRHREFEALVTSASADPEPGDDMLDRAAAMLGTDFQGVIAYSVKVFQAGAERQRAVNEYTVARRMLEAVGVV